MYVICDVFCCSATRFNNVNCNIGYASMTTRNSTATNLSKFDYAFMSRNKQSRKYLIVRFYKNDEFE